ncbi:MAG TPA: chemotaxis protein CheW [Candidatus Angelobacter sp.]|nr:chemotaxis protein CheW [Candidatus Angelobacter sp.]
MTVTLPTWFDDDVVEPESAGVEHVVVRLGGGRYGIRAQDVAEVVRLPGTTRLPGTPAWVCGVANWRGHVLPLVDLRPLLQVPAVPLPSSARVVVLAVGDLEVGLLAEAVAGLVEVPEQLDPGHVTLAGDAADLVAGLADGGPGGPVAVLRTASVLGLRSRIARTGR